MIGRPLTAGPLPVRARQGAQQVSPDLLDLDPTNVDRLHADRVLRQRGDH